MEKPKYDTIIPAEVRYNENLSMSAKVIYSEIIALCCSEDEGVKKISEGGQKVSSSRSQENDANGKKFHPTNCSNSTIAELYGMTERAVRMCIKQLVDNGFVEKSKNENGKTVLSIPTDGKKIQPATRIIIKDIVYKDNISNGYIYSIVIKEYKLYIYTK